MDNLQEQNTKQQKEIKEHHGRWSKAEKVLFNGLL